MTRGRSLWAALALLCCGYTGAADVASFSVAPSPPGATACQVSAAVALEKILNGMVDKGYRFSLEKGKNKQPGAWTIDAPEKEASGSWVCNIIADVKSCNFPTSGSDGRQLAAVIRDDLLLKAQTEKGGNGTIISAKLHVDLVIQFDVLGKLRCTPNSPSSLKSINPPPSPHTPTLGILVFLSLLLFLCGLLAAHIRLRRNVVEIRGTSAIQASRLVDIESDIQALKAAMAGAEEDAYEARFNQMKRQIADLPQTVTLAETNGQPVGEPPPDAVYSVTVEAPSILAPMTEIGWQWIELINTARPFDTGKQPWRICGVDISNFDERQLLPGVPPEWDILGESPEAIRRARFWLLGQRDSDFSILVPSYKLISERALWLQGGSGMINALMQGHYKWDRGVAFAALDVARISFDKESNEITVIEEGRLVLDLY